MTAALYCVAAFAISCVLTPVLIRLNIKDKPNNRSLHDRPTPKSGGIAFSVAFIAVVAVAIVRSPVLAQDLVLTPLQWGLCLGGLILVIAIALADDIMVLSAAIKFSGQIAIATVFTVWVVHVDTLSLPGLGEYPLGPFGYVFTILWIVFFMNAFNFMDGINGIAGGSAVVGSLFLAGIAIGAGAGAIAFLSLVLASAVLGFLPFNYPRARIFMGDTGSQSVAFLVSTLAVLGTQSVEHKVSFFIVPLLYLPFLFDVFITLIRRLRRGEKVWEAHREHVYQLAVQLGRGHAEVSAAYFLLSVVCGVAALSFSQRPDIHAFWGVVLLMTMMGAMSWTVYKAFGARAQGAQ